MLEVVSTTEIFLILVRYIQICKLITLRMRQMHLNLTYMYKQGADLSHAYSLHIMHYNDDIKMNI